MLKEKSTLKINSDDFTKFRFHIVPNNATVIANAQNGVDYFTKTYFNLYSHLNPLSNKFWQKGVLKDSITTDEYFTIISQLYKFNIAARRDCVTGYLTIVIEDF
jgi:hypothetical protein